MRYEIIIDHKGQYHVHDTERQKLVAGPFHFEAEAWEYIYGEERE